MRPTRWLRLAVGAVLPALHPRPAHAQAGVDSAGLAAGVARFIAEDLIAEFTAVPAVVIGPPGTRFDSLVAGEMARHPVFQRPPRDSARAAEIQTRGFTEIPYAPEHLRGLPAVLVRVSGCTPSDQWGEGWHWWANQTWYVFRQTERGWELAGAQPVDNADGGCAPPEEDGPQG